MASTRFNCFSSTEKSFILPIPGNMPRIFSKGPSLRIILNCARKSLKSKVAVRIFFSMRRGFLLVDGLRGPLDQAERFAHAEDAAGEAVRVKRLELVELFADAGEFDRALGHLAHGERRAAAGIAVELGEDEAGDLEGVVEMGGHAHRLLAGGGVGRPAALRGAGGIP